MTFTFETKLKKSLNKAFLRRPVFRDDLLRFRDVLFKFIDLIDPARTDEHAKNLLADFLRETFYSNEFQVNIHDKIGVSIAKGGIPQVLITTLGVGEASKMITGKKSHPKAVRQVFSNFLEERLAKRNLEIKTLIVTDLDHWFVFDAKDFEALAQKNPAQVKQNTNFSGQIAQLWNANRSSSLHSTYFALKNTPKDLESLTPLYKLLSPTHLMKEPIQIDSNTLDRNFYEELMYWMGLEESKVGSKPVIRRRAKPQPGSLVELILDRLPPEDCVPPGMDRDEIAMELALLWVNRLLFLKQMDSQLSAYHNNDQAFRFLAPDSLKDFSELQNLFFEAVVGPNLASLPFELSQLEKRFFSIDKLDSHTKLPVWSRSVLKTSDEFQKIAPRSTLDYLLQFLEAFDFSPEGTWAVQSNRKPYVSASALGLIFEKFNGYADGAYFTPGYITEFMAKQVVRAAILTKFNQTKGWDCEEWVELRNRLGQVSKTEDLADANRLINGLKFLDPAVGTGHFLVSVLNELVAAKSDLGILIDRHGIPLGQYRALVENDGLFLLDQEGGIVTYHAPFGQDDRQRVWETIFHEKKVLIEGSLFGVDINPNSVQICKSRLRIELLKHAFYTRESAFQELETHPNLDIKIREGNSLVSRYSLEVPLDEIGPRGPGLPVKFVGLVRNYQKAPDKKLKWEIEKCIQAVKDQIKEESKEPIFRNSFEWRFEFPEVLDPGTGDFVGFDVVIGNPPYGTDLGKSLEYVRSRPELAQVIKSYAEIFKLFFPLSFGLLKENGLASLITPNVFLSQPRYKDLRNYLLTKTLLEFVDLGEGVFTEAVVPVCISLLKNGNPKPYYNFNRFDHNQGLYLIDRAIFSKVNLVDVVNSDSISFIPHDPENRKRVPLGDILDLRDAGLQYHRSGIGLKNKGGNDLFERIISSDSNQFKESIPIYYGKLVDRYTLAKATDEYFNLNYKDSLKKELKESVSFNREAFQKKPKLLWRQTAGSIQATLDTQGIWFRNTIQCGWIREIYGRSISPYLILGILNSHYFNFLYQKCVNETEKKRFPQVKLSQLRQIPIPSLLESGETPEAGEIEKLVAQILSIKTTTPDTDTRGLETQIDRLVYKLYDLTDEEIAVAEGKA